MQDKRVALITGANQGIGLQVAKELVANGLSVLVGSRNFARRGRGKGDWFGRHRAPTRRNGSGFDRRRGGTSPQGIWPPRLARQQRCHLQYEKGQPVPAGVRRITLASNASLDEIRAVWETNVFGVLAVYQAMLPLLRKSSAAASSTYRAESAR
jgi:NAD(P)-dependent dehydrogenase (short-subunit alcohol dehydrogenase family)